MRPGVPVPSIAAVVLAAPGAPAAHAPRGKGGQPIPKAEPLRVAGLSLAERACRVARRVGASEVFLVETEQDLQRLQGWRPRADRLLVLRAQDQLVHPPLVTPLVEQAGTVVAVAPRTADAADLREGEYAGAFISDRVQATLAALAAGRGDRALAHELLATGAVTRPHGPIARHPVTCPKERAAAEKLLYQTLVKPQDNIIARALFRPVSLAMTRVLVATPVTPNQLTTVTMILVALGLWLTAQPQPSSAILGSLVILLSNYVDCCDGEIARLKLCSSRLGAWYDTIVDELSSLGYMLALGWHCHLHAGARMAPAFDPWLAAMTLGAVTYAISLYCVYFNIILVARSANSQDYVSRVELAAGDRPGSWELRPVAQKPMALPASWPRQLVATVGWLPNMIRRDFIVWASLLLVTAGLAKGVFAAMVAGGVVTATVVLLDHLQLRAQLGALRERAGLSNA
jgi:phosphatidylglycerophosphate synthase